MKRFAQVVSIVTLAFVVGLQWTALQSVGWASMLLSRARAGTLSEAVQTTFDGEHPCEICRWVAAGRKAEKQSPTLQELLKMEATVPESGAMLPPAPPVARTFHRPCDSPGTRSEVPPLPPPRTA